MRILSVLLLFVTAVCFVHSARKGHRSSHEVLEQALLAAWHGDHANLTRLVQDGLDPNTETAGMTLLGVAASRGHDPAVVALIRCGADVDRRVSGGQTPLMLAAIGGNAATARTLLAAGADVNATDDVGFTVLMYALISRDPERVRLALAMGADVDLRNARGVTAKDIAEADDNPLILRIMRGDDSGRRAETCTFPSDGE